MKSNVLIPTLDFLQIMYSSCNRVDNEKLQNQAWNTVKQINYHWSISEDIDSLGFLIHPDMVIIYPDSKDRLLGKSNIIKSYKDYTDYAQTISFNETNPLIQLYNKNKTAVVTYDYALKIKDPNGHIQTFSGRDMYTLIYENKKWIAVAQHYSPFPQ